jgi:hypothetical protein
VFFNQDKFFTQGYLGNWSSSLDMIEMENPAMAFLRGGLTLIFFNGIFSSIVHYPRRCRETSMDKTKLKESVCQAIEQEKEKIIGWSKAIAGKPELGYKEMQTAEFIRTAFAGLGLPTRGGIAATGVEGLLEGGRPGPGLLFMGEMDAVVNRESSLADPVTGAAHLCGHHLQVGIITGDPPMRGSPPTKGLMP